MLLLIHGVRRMTTDQPVTQLMNEHIKNWEIVSDQRATFLRCYLLMTENMLGAIEADQFHDSKWVYTFLHRFADYYFDALDAYEVNRAAAPEVWVRVHDAAISGTTRVIQNLLLGINTHINYDLIFTLVDVLEPEWERLSLAERDLRQSDHNHVNQIIADTINAVQDQVLESLVPEMDLVDKLLGPLDEWLISGLISHWRDDVWQKAVDLLETKEPRERAHKKGEIENQTQIRASTILLEDGKIDLFGMV
jgi:hypothetical protein